MAQNELMKCELILHNALWHNNNNNNHNNCWQVLAREHTILVNREKSKILSDVRLEACTVEHYPA